MPVEGGLQMEQLHGGNLVEAANKYGIPVEKFVDFSANINFLGVPASVEKAIRNSLHLVACYPDPQCRALKQALHCYTGVEESNLLVGNGASELIFLVVRALKPRRVLLLNPTFGEYARAVTAVGGEISSVFLLPENGFLISLLQIAPFLREFDLLFLCNPNNPTGTLWKREEVIELIEKAAVENTAVVVDEAFMDFVEEAADFAVLKEVEHYSNLIVLRSLTKYFALAGIRLGYIAAPKGFIQEMEKLRDPWSVNWLAQVAGVAALRDQEYQEKTRWLMRAERDFLYQGLASIPFLQVWPSAANFFLVRLLVKGFTAKDLQERLAGRGVLIRRGDSFPGLGPEYFRVAVRKREENLLFLDLLQNTLTEVVRRSPVAYT